MLSHSPADLVVRGAVIVYYGKRKYYSPIDPASIHCGQQLIGRAGASAVPGMTDVGVRVVDPEAVPHFVAIAEGNVLQANQSRRAVSPSIEIR
jgi:hypothetical protein